MKNLPAPTPLLALAMLDGCPNGATTDALNLAGGFEKPMLDKMLGDGLVRAYVQSVKMPDKIEPHRKAGTLGIRATRQVLKVTWWYITDKGRTAMKEANK